MRIFLNYEIKMIDKNTLERCLSDMSEVACVARIENVVDLSGLLLSACMLFMTIAAVGSVVELSSKRAYSGGVLKFVTAVGLSAYLVFIPLGAYSLKVFNAESTIVDNLQDISWFHYLNELGSKNIT
ncbi:MAG: hypothetical protein ACI87J_001531 [Colwellia sp.]